LTAGVRFVGFPRLAAAVWFELNLSLTNIACPAFMIG
jgi:hypothetical protein